MESVSTTGEGFSDNDINPAGGADPAHLRELSPAQWKCGVAAWLGWLFDGLDQHLYVLVALPFVAELLGNLELTDKRVGYYSSWIQAAFLFGYAIGGSIFGRIGDLLGRSRTMMLTILTYALFTGLGYFAQTWWQLLIYRFVAALGIGGEWAVGSALLAETWPRRFRPWISAMLQTAGNLGVLLAVLVTFVLAEYPSRTVFLVGVLPAFLVLWIRRAVPESKEWQAARLQATHTRSGVGELFRGPIRRTTLLILIVCTLSLTAHWAFLFWYQQNLRNLPDLAPLDPAQKTRMLGWVVSTLTIVSIGGNFLAAALARRLGFRRAIAFMFLAYFLSLAATYSVPLGYSAIWVGCLVIGVCQGVFALFTMYLPPLFPTLLRTTGMGFCYNIGRIVAGLGTVAFGLSTTGGDYRLALLYAGFLFLPAAAVAWFLPEVSQQQAGFTT